ncbi:MAG: DUF4974 domain-containing protein [Dysgonomonas sp.]
MVNNYISKVIHKFLGSEYSSQTELKVQKWLLEKENGQEKERCLNEFWNDIESSEKEEPSPMAYKALLSVKKKLEIPLKRKLSFSYILPRVAAILIPIILFAGGYLYYNTHIPKDHFTEFITLNGEQRHIVLPDGSEVWLNDATILRYTEKLEGKTRDIQLFGEAYFKVKKDSLRPFIVKSDYISLTVLGTEFNVKAYTDERETIATLASGSIQVVTNDNKAYIMKPDEQLIYNNITKETKLHEVPANDISIWRDGYIVFNNTPLDEILHIVERRYNVTFDIQGRKLANDTYSLKFKNSTPLDEVLAVLSDIVGFTYRVDNNRKVVLQTKSK